MRVTVTVRDSVGGDLKTREIARIKGIVDRDIERIANRAESVIRSTINNKTAGGTGKLANSDAWIPERIDGGWGVGDIPTLDAEVPYWNHQDKGSEGIGANWQHFLPKGFWSNGRWVESSSGFSGIMPNSPIPALNYIADSLLEMEMQIPILLKG